MSFETLMLLGAAGMCCAVVWTLGRDAWKRQHGSGLLLLTGLLLFAITERALGDHAAWLPAILGSVGLITTALALRLRATKATQPGHAEAHKTALLWSAVAACSVLAYLVSLDATAALLSLDDAATGRWRVVWQCAAALAAVVGLSPTLFIDRSLTRHAHAMLPGLARRSAEAGLGVGLMLGLVMPVNYLASQSSLEWDHAYFRTTRPGTATAALVQTLTDPVEVTLFFQPGNDVGQEVRPYFEELSILSGGLLTFRQADQALDPDTAKALKIRDNGFVALQQGDSNQKFKLGTDLSRAKTDLRKLDATVHKHLLKLTKDKQTLYLFSGHGEANYKERENPLRAIQEFKKSMEEANFTVKSLGVAEGSGVAVPDDAAVIVIASPETEPLEEEFRTLIEYVDNGGALFILKDPGDANLTPLLSHLGVHAGEHRLANAEVYYAQTRGPADRVLIATNKFGSHEAVRTLSRNSQQLGMILPTATWVGKLPDGPRKISTLIRSMNDTWEDKNQNFEADSDEPKKTYQLGVAIENLDETAIAGRAIVVGDVNFLSDPAFTTFPGSRVFARDAIRWLTKDEALSGDISSEQDVKIVHTREEDQAWFWGTVVGFPLAILGVGLLNIRRRRTRS